MMVKNIFLILIVTFFGVKCLAQAPVYLEYDFLNPARMRIGYISSAGDTIFQRKRNIKVEGNTPVIIHLTNYNSDALQVKTSVKTTSAADSVPVLRLSGFFDALGSLMIPALGQDLSKMLPLARGRGEQKPEELARIRPNTPEMALLRDPDDIVALDTVIKRKLMDVANWKSVLVRINRLRFSTHLTPNEIRKQAREIMDDLAPDAAQAFRDESNARFLVMQVARENASYLRNALTLYEDQVKRSPASRGNNTGIDEYDIARENFGTYQAYINDRTENDLQQTLEAIADDFQGIMSNGFETMLYTSIDRKSELLSLNFYRKPGAPAKEPAPAEILHTESIPIWGKRGIGVYNSLGISMIRYNKGLENYFVLGDKIVSTPTDQMVPSVGIYLHITDRSEAGFKLGGHLGVGIPLANAASYNLQFGPSLVLGPQNMVFISLGAFTGKVERLGGGLKVGDTVPAGTTLPAPISRFEWGYQLGLSFNMAALLKM